MNHIKTDILIIGAGLTGLTLGYLLRSADKNVVIVEARKRSGGRIETYQTTQAASMEMGATWLGSQHTRLHKLLAELDINTYEQELGSTAFYEPMSTSPPQLVQLPLNDNPSYKIQGGTQRLTDRLEECIDPSAIYFNTKINQINDHEEQFLVSSQNLQFTADIIITTLPPHLLLQSIKFIPALPDLLVSCAMATHTWMGESIKICVAYPEPFWKEKNSSGTLFSNVGPIPELYDHSTDRQSALVGFLNPAYHNKTKEERLQLITAQLSKYYGDKACHILKYEERLWRKETFTYLNYPEPVLPHQNNGHPLYSNPYLQDKLWIAGSETATQFPGYMEGAVRSAEFIYEQLKSTIL